MINMLSEASTVKRVAQVLILWLVDNVHHVGTLKRLNCDRFVTVAYDDSDHACLNVDDENGIFEKSTMLAYTYHYFNETTNSSNKLLGILDALSVELSEYPNISGTKALRNTKHKALNNPQLSMCAKSKKTDVFKNVKLSPSPRDVPQKANIVKTHTLYNVETNEDGSRKLKSRTISHGYEDALMESITSY